MNPAVVRELLLALLGAGLFLGLVILLLNLPALKDHWRHEKQKRRR